MRGSRYAGITGAGLQSFTQGVGDQYIQQQKAVLRDRVLKTWTAERKEQLRKYSEGVSQLQRLRDGINERVPLKSAPNGSSVGGDSEFQAHMAKFTVEFDNRAAIVNDMMKGLVEDY